ncbi:MAG: FG-GAP repeat domain-containing protein, partial [Chloroflexota bacterium]
MSPRALVLLRAASLLGVLLAPPLSVHAAAAGKTGAATGDTEAAACVDGWTRLAVSAPVERWQAYEILTSADQLAWLLGGSNEGALALAWREGKWKRVAVASDDTAALQAGVIADDGSVWSVGSLRPARAVMQPIAGLLKPRRWRNRPIKGVPAERVALAGVATKGADRAWAVGTKLLDGRTKAYAVRWTGSRWQERSPSSDKAESGLTAVASTETGDVWAVGWEQGRSGRLRPLVAKLKGNGWETSRGAALPAGNGALTDVQFSSRRDGWAVGYNVPEGSSRYEVVLERWDGKAWSLVPLPWAADISAVPRSVAVDDEGRVWIAGTLLQEGTGARGFVARREGDTWRLDDDLLPAEPGSELFSVAVLGDGAIVAGVAGSDAVVLATCEQDAPPDDASSGRETASLASVTSVTSVALTAANAAPAGWSKLAGRLDLGRPTKPSGFEIRDVADEAGMAAVVATTRGLTQDLDGDGWTDVLYWNHTDPPHFLLGGPDGFRAARPEAFGQLDRHWCSVADVNGDSELDVFCSSGRKRGRGIGRHELSLSPAFENGGPVADIGGVIDPFGRGRATAFIDLDGDDLPELFVATSADRGDGMPGMNRFFRNVNGRFVPAPEVGLDRSTGGWCALAVDIDADGDEDLLHCLDRSDDKRVEGLRIYINEDGKLRGRSKALSIEPRRGIAVLVEDLTGDGRLDIA